MPTRERSFGRLVDLSITLVPATVIWPFWKGSRAFTHLMSVDLPEPEGPQTTTTSPLATLVVQSVSTLKSPYHLLMPSMAIIVSPGAPFGRPETRPPGWRPGSFGAWSASTAGCEAVGAGIGEEVMVKVP